MAVDTTQEGYYMDSFCGCLEGSPKSVSFLCLPHVFKELISTCATLEKERAFSFSYIFLSFR